MKKTLIATLIGLTALTLGACGYETGSTVYNGKFKVLGTIGTGEEYSLLRDVDTGCIYIERTSSYPSISAFFDENGKVAGCGQTDFDTKKYDK
ncbi:putative signal peptide-containing lipoprotein [Bacillus phage Izhevsk]|uniref:Putative signal peptide-containing lipoprotein n=1 Tax=Bacillus phage Izhevsk TaxID=2724322 RepID=A0A6H0X646_9CAUD|nr:putative signal peptide-containing lipoprotein [Bacillus phage Izhevsk]QIW89785.1 putative signal peptide-containing lipoprotein [Bacillus phage Izhevsk]